MYRELYGPNHPYTHIDATPESVQRITRRNLQTFHRAHFAPNNAFLVAVGDVSAEDVRSAADRHFARWASRRVPGERTATPPTRNGRSVVVVDRPGSVQSVIMLGNLALARNSPDYVPLRVANQVLGGSAASRLFMDLREQRSLTYGAYSAVGERAQVAPFVAYAAVRNEVTTEAMAGFMEHLDRIVAEAPEGDEVLNAQRYLSDSFPLEIETAGRIANMVEELRIYELPDDYWASYRTSIREVTPEQAFEAAQEYIRPNTGVMVAVGAADAIVEPLRRYGDVRVIDTDGNEVARFEALEANSEE